MCSVTIRARLQSPGWSQRPAQVHTVLGSRGSTWGSQELFTPPGNPGCSQGAGGRASEDAFPCNLHHRVPRGRVLPGGSRHQLPRTHQETPQTHQARAPALPRGATSPAGSELRKQTWKLPGLIAPKAAASRGDATCSRAWASAHTRVTTDPLRSRACVLTDIPALACVCYHRLVLMCVTTDMARLLLGCSARGDRGPSWDRTPTCLSIPTSASVHATCLRQRRTPRAQRGVKPHPPCPLQAQWGREDSAPSPGGRSSPSPSPTAHQALPAPCTLPVTYEAVTNSHLSHFPQDTVSSAWTTPLPTPTLRGQVSSVQTPGWGLPWVMPKAAGACPTMTPHHQDQTPSPHPSDPRQKARGQQGRVPAQSGQCPEPMGAPITRGHATRPGTPPTLLSPGGVLVGPLSLADYPRLPSELSRGHPLR